VQKQWSDERETTTAAAGLSVRLFYGWHIVAASIATQAFAVGLTTYTFGLFQKPVAAEFGASFQQVGLGMTFKLVASSLIAPGLGVGLDR
jgi:hypothetical protein